MAAALVGGAFLSAALQVLFDRLASRPVVDFIRGRKLISDAPDAPLKKLKAPLKKLEKKLRAVNAVLNHAEEKQMTDEAVKDWLDELKDTIYNAEDLLDAIATEALRCKLEAESRTSTDPVCNSISPSLNSFDEGQLESKINEILGELEDILEQKDVLDLKKDSGGMKISQKLPTTSLVEESEVYGRDDDRKEITKFLLSDDETGNEVCVIAIVGMGGVGKTTLAQLAYNNHEVNQHFDLNAWVCVSEEFDVLRVTETILKAVTSSTDDSKDLNVLQVKLKKIFSGKKFLLVLDDVWNEDYCKWDLLQSPFKSGMKGSRIIVTTRHERVASIMRAVSTYPLNQLREEDCWLLFARHAFNNGNFSAHPDLELIGRQIVKKCKGLPLAAKALGGLLRSKLDAEEWNKILKSDIWDLPCGKSNILPALRLSYHYLPSHLKRCFVYCSIFPKDYEFKKEQLVLLWMAEEFLQLSNENKIMEEVGDDYFHDLVSRSFFQRSSSDQTRFVMHDLVNDLAIFVSGEFCFRLEGDNPHKISEKIRHLSYIQTHYDVSKKFEAFNDAKCLRTFLPLPLYAMSFAYSQLSKKVLHDLLLPTRSCLRVLSLSHYLNIGELPESIGNLKHLRYLNLSSTTIKRLPDCTCTLFNLQTLLLSNCRSLIELPANMERLINLRHLDVRETKLKEMPMHMSRLRSLQSLSTFIVGNCNGSMITELRKFQHLQGTLHIRELQNVVDAKDASQANLKDKKYVDELVLEWRSNNENSQNERDVLDKLQPHTKLKNLTIKHYGGTRFADWLVNHSLCNMVCLRLENCKYCFSLPPLGQLPCLKDLRIEGLVGVEKVGPEFYGNGSSVNKPFGSLKILKFEMMLEWEEWIYEGVEFPCLVELVISRCPKLNSGLPGQLSSLRQLELNECDRVLLRSNNDEMAILPCLEELRIGGMSELKELPSWLQRLTIKELHITGCPSLESFPRGGLPTTLKSLSISNCPSLESFPRGALPTTLKSLSISNCPSLESFPRGALPTTLKSVSIRDCRKLELLLLEAEETTHNYYASLEELDVMSCCDSLKSFPLHLLPKLNYLSIRGCENLESLWIPEGAHEDATSLHSLYISSCPKLVSFPLLPSLRDLKIIDCPELESFPEGGLPCNLKSLHVSRMERGLQTLASLNDFSISRCEEVESFPDEWLLPSTLTSLEIWRLPNLKYLNKRGMQHLTSLQELSIWYCPKLQCFPEEGLPTSLSSIAISGCPLLEQRCQREKGEYWPKIEHIPCIVIDGELIS